MKCPEGYTITFYKGADIVEELDSWDKAAFCVDYRHSTITVKNMKEAQELVDFLKVIFANGKKARSNYVQKMQKMMDEGK